MLQTSRIRPFKRCWLSENGELGEVANSPKLFPKLASKRTEQIGFVGAVGAVFLFVVLFLRHSFFLYDRFALQAYDLGIYDQATWLISRGYTPFLTIRGVFFLADHFSVDLYFLAPLLWVWNSPKALLAFQTVAIGAGALPFYGIAYRRVGPSLALFFAVLYLLYPALHWDTTTDYHPDTIVPLLLMASLYAVERRRYSLTFMLLFAAALCRETIGFTILAYGLWLALSERRVGLAMALFGLVVQVLTLLIMRHFNGGHPTAYIALYSLYGTTPFQIVFNLLLHPWWILEAAVKQSALRFYLYLLLPVGGLALLGPKALLPAAPELMLDVLSSRAATRTLTGHYTITLAPFVLYAALLGFCSLRERVHSNRLGLAIAWVGACALFSAWRWSPLKISAYIGASAQDSAEIAHALKQIPSGASVSAQSALATHLCHRKQCYLFPNPYVKVVWGGGTEAIGQLKGKNPLPVQPKVWLDAAFLHGASLVQYVALSPTTSIFPLGTSNYDAYVLALLKCPRYQLLAIGRAVLLFKRGGNHLQGLQLLAPYVGHRVKDEATLEKAYWIWRRQVPHPALY